MRASYRLAVEWIAYNDEPLDKDPESIRSYISTLLVADLFGKEPEAVAKDILRKRSNSATLKFGYNQHSRIANS